MRNYRPPHIFISPSLLSSLSLSHSLYSYFTLSRTHALSLFSPLFSSFLLFSPLFSSFLLFSPLYSSFLLFSAFVLGFIAYFGNKSWCSVAQETDFRNISCRAKNWYQGKCSLSCWNQIVTKWLISLILLCQSSLFFLNILLSFFFIFYLCSYSFTFLLSRFLFFFFLFLLFHSPIRFPPFFFSTHLLLSFSFYFSSFLLLLHFLSTVYQVLSVDKSTGLMRVSRKALLNKKDVDDLSPRKPSPVLFDSVRTGMIWFDF